MSSPETPKSIESHQKDYRPMAWLEYDFAEYGMWVQLLTIRAQHRADGEKIKKDLDDASNYLDMMRAKLDWIRKEILER